MRLFDSAIAQDDPAAPVFGPQNSTYALDLTTSFDTATGAALAMKRLPDMPARLSLALAGFAPDGKKIRITAGQGHNSEKVWTHNIDGVFEYVVADRAWRALAQTNFDKALPDSKLFWTSSEGTVNMASIPASAAQRATLIGGVSAEGNELGDVRQITVGTSGERVTEPPNAPWPSPRKMGLVLRLNSTHVFYSGGFTGENSALDDWWTRDTRARPVKWVQGKEKMRVARFGHRGVFVDNRFVILSGGFSSTAPSSLLECIDLHTGRVTAVTTIASPNTPPAYLAWHSAVLAGRDQLLLFGGFLEWDVNNNEPRHNRRMYVAKLRMDAASADAPISVTWASQFDGIKTNTTAASFAAEPPVLVPGAAPTGSGGDVAAAVIVDNSGLQGWAIGAIVAGVVVTTLLVAGALVVLTRRRRRAKQQRKQSEAELAQLVDARRDLTPQFAQFPPPNQQQQHAAPQFAPQQLPPYAYPASPPPPMQQQQQQQFPGAPVQPQQFALHPAYPMPALAHSVLPTPDQQQFDSQVYPAQRATVMQQHAPVPAELRTPRVSQHTTAGTRQVDDDIVAAPRPVPARQGLAASRGQSWASVTTAHDPEFDLEGEFKADPAAAKSMPKTIQEEEEDLLLPGGVRMVVPPRP
ncbi:hypothetical protein H9P43_007017 [Blastocladiella emersonii ATCC 22665]|nr:hypothetical protein H9P43_007017 [Blastocladiella emersonii ATCC 22665]